MKKALIALIVLLITLLLYILYNDESTAKLQMKDADILQVNKTDILPINSTSYVHTTDNDKIDNTIEESYPKNQSYSIFEELDIDSVRLDTEPIEGVEPIAALRMKKNTIKEIELGDTILLPSIEGSTYELTVTHKEVSSRGNVSIDGSFSENGVKYTAILTEGSKATFISMNTPEGTYEIALLNGIGYVYANSDINKAKIDYTKTDEVTVHKEEY
jgi:hypothetical protein